MCLLKIGQMYKIIVMSYMDIFYPESASEKAYICVFLTLHILQQLTFTAVLSLFLCYLVLN